MSAITVERSYLLDELGDPNAPVGSRLWCLYMANEIRKDLYENTQAEQRLYYLVKTFKETNAWQPLGFDSWQDFCRKRLQTDSERVDNKAMMLAKAATPLNGHGTNQHTGRYDHNVLKAEQRGESADYLTRRIARDHPDILARMQAGEFKSVRQAALAAGLVKKYGRFYIPETPAEAGRFLAAKVDREWIDAMIEEYIRAKREA